jgi:riboflavin kinase/FMN adenylyltransferase
VITFDHHPDEILTGHAPPLLCDPEERLRRLEAAGVAVTVVQHFDVALRETRYDAFVRGIAERVDLAGFLMTPDSAFGYERAGTSETVAALGRESGYEVAVVPPFTLAGGPVSSSKIRAAIAAGDLATAEHLLGRPYSVVGGLEPAADGAAEVAFPMPVALPPDGQYGIDLKWDGTEPIAGRAHVANGVLRVPELRGSPAAGRVAVTFASAG